MIDETGMKIETVFRLEAVSKLKIETVFRLGAGSNMMIEVSSDLEQEVT